jgi:hypothetical protein
VQSTVRAALCLLKAIDSAFSDIIIVEDDLIFLPPIRYVVCVHYRAHNVIDKPLHHGPWPLCTKGRA